MTPFPAPNRLHVWWARRPLVASRAAILASILPATADRATFTHMPGILGDPIASRRRIDLAKRTGVRFEGEAYDYGRAFGYLPTRAERAWLSEQTGPRIATLLDPTAGGGSIAFEAIRLGLTTSANDLNPVAATILSATIDYPSRLGTTVLEAFHKISKKFVERRERLLAPLPD